MQITLEPVAASGWEVVKRQLGESLAKHLTSCGFKSSLRGILATLLPPFLISSDVGDSALVTIAMLDSLMFKFA